MVIVKITLHNYSIDIFDNVKLIICFTFPVHGQISYKTTKKVRDSLRKDIFLVSIDTFNKN